MGILQSIPRHKHRKSESEGSSTGQSPSHCTRWLESESRVTKSESPKSDLSRTWVRVTSHTSLSIRPKEVSGFWSPRALPQSSRSAFLKIDYNGIMISAVLLFSFEKCVMITNILLLFNKTCSFMQNKIQFDRRSTTQKSPVSPKALNSWIIHTSCVT